MNINPALLADIATIRQAIKENLAIARPTTLNKMQLDELKYLLAVYENELKIVTKGLPLIGTEALSKEIEGTSNYIRHEQFNDKNRGL